jgi:hypothetical protein
MRSGRNAVASDYEWSVAVHEAGHCLGFRVARQPIDRATIEPTARYEGNVRPAPGILGWDKEIVVDLLGHQAELEFGVGTCGHYKDEQHAVSQIKSMLKIEKHGLDAACKTARWQFGSYQLWREHQKMLRLTKAEWQTVLNRYRRHARRLAKKHRAWIEQVAKLLIKKRTLTDKEISQL